MNSILAITNEQAGAGMPEQPEVALVIRTNQPKEMESAIHKLLDRVPDAPGTEWLGRIQAK